LKGEAHAAKLGAHLLLVVEEVLVSQQLFRVLRQIRIAGPENSLAAEAVAEAFKH
jgi:hypothetical protein